MQKKPGECAYSDSRGHLKYPADWLNFCRQGSYKPQDHGEHAVIARSYLPISYICAYANCPDCVCANDHNMTDTYDKAAFDLIVIGSGMECFTGSSLSISSGIAEGIRSIRHHGGCYISSSASGRENPRYRIIHACWRDMVSSTNVSWPENQQPPRNL